MTEEVNPLLFNPANAHRFTAEMKAEGRICIDQFLVREVDFDHTDPNGIKAVLKVYQPVDHDFIGQLLSLRNRGTFVDLTIKFLDPTMIVGFTWELKGPICALQLGKLDYSDSSPIMHTITMYSATIASSTQKNSSTQKGTNPPRNSALDPFYDSSIPDNEQ